MSEYQVGEVIYHMPSRGLGRYRRMEGENLIVLVPNMHGLGEIRWASNDCILWSDACKYINAFDLIKKSFEDAGYEIGNPHQVVELINDIIKKKEV